MAIDVRSDQLVEQVQGCHTVVHLAGVNRGSDDALEHTNEQLAERLAHAAEGAGRPRVVYASTVRQVEDTPYGRGKRAAGRTLEAAARVGAVSGLRTLVIPNVFGARARPYHNSVVATFCHQLSHGEKPTVIQDAELGFIHVNELVTRIAALVDETWEGVASEEVDTTWHTSVSGLLGLLESFQRSAYDTHVVPELHAAGEKALWATFLSYMPLEDLHWRPEVHSDQRGLLFELVRGGTGGQTFVSTSHPGVVRGNHYHTHKLERFCVLAGEAVIRLRRIDRDEVVSFQVDGATPSIVEIPVFHTHNIENTGDGELLTLFWANELFDPDDPDTYPDGRGGGGEGRHMKVMTIIGTRPEIIRLSA